MSENANYPIQNSINNIWTDDRVMTSGERSYFVKFFSQDFSANTKKALKSDFGHFLLWYVGTNHEPFRFTRFTESDITNYKQACQQRGHAPSTINRRLTHLRMLCDFFVKEGRMKQNVAKNIKSLKTQRLAPKSLELPDLRKITKEVELRGNLRDHLIFAMFSGAGFRVSELSALKIEDIVLTDRKGHAIVRNGKGGKTREVPLKNAIREPLKQYIAGRDPSERVFQGQRGNLTPIAFNKIIDFYAKKAGIKCHPHQLRHTFSYQFLEQTQNDIVALAQILGHSNLSTTAIYTQRRLSDLQEKVERMSL